MAGDDELIRRCLKQDQDAWNELLQRYAGVTKGHVLYLLKKHQCTHLIDDHLEKIVLHIFEELYINLPSYHFVNFRSWFTMLRISKTLQYLKDELRFRSRTVQLGGERMEMEIAVDNIPGRRAENPSSHLYRQEVLSILDSLPSKYSLPLRMFYFQGLSYNEIADILGISNTNVGVRLARGLEKLRTKFSGER